MTFDPFKEELERYLKVLNPKTRSRFKNLMKVNGSLSFYEYKIAVEHLSYSCAAKIRQRDLENDMDEFSSISQTHIAGGALAYRLILDKLADMRFDTAITSSVAIKSSSPMDFIDCLCDILESVNLYPY